MFTGIIEEKGQIVGIQKDEKSMEMTIQSSKILSDVTLGDSIAVNGVCLTVTHFNEDTITVEVMPETVKSTAIHQLKKGDYVNLERAMPTNGRFGGHIVSGHVDGVGTICSKKALANAVYYEIELSKELIEHCIPKGSITIDGISLTIFDVKNSKITISLIPHTYSETILGMKKVGDKVNIETDLLGKYILHYLQKSNQTSTITQEFLNRNGF